MANPVFSRAEAFQPQGSFGGPYANQAPYQGQGNAGQYNAGQYNPWGPQAQAVAADGMTDPHAAAGVSRSSERSMTLDDVVWRTGMVLLIIAAIGAVTYQATIHSPGLMGGALVLSSIVGFITVLIVSTRRRVPPAGVVAYGVIEGVFIGAFSALFESLYPGIVVQAVLGTFAAAGVTLAAYKFSGIRVTPRFRRVVVISTFGFAGVMLLNFILSLFGVNVGMRTVGGGVSMIAILASAVGVVLAALNLVMDFDYAEQGVRNQAPVSEAWRAAFGIAVTMVWLYTEIVRILSYFRD